MSYVGTYNFRQNAESLDAISVVTPGANLPATREVEGLEVVIHDAGEVKSDLYYDSSVQVTTWPVFLILWEPGTGTEFQKATERILAIFPGAEAIQVVAVSDGLGAMVQNKIMIKSNMPILLP